MMDENKRYSADNQPQEAVIAVNSLSKIYPLYGSPRDRVKEALHPKRRKYHSDFYALRDLSFEIRKGETIGIIGQNGSGKSTLLKILSGLLTPTSGTCHVNGKVSSLLELGTGFNPELTGIENVYFNGALLGFKKEEMNSKLDDILSFADIGKFLTQPVKTYSSGMYVRLAFAVAVQVDPDILIIDEALSVGDSYFQVKSMNKILKLVESGKTVIFVSHDQTAVKILCKRAILLDKGTVIKDSEASPVVDYYHNMILNMLHQGEEDLLYNPKPQQAKNPDTTVLSEDKIIVQGDVFINTRDVDLLSVHVYNSMGDQVDNLTSEENIKIVCKIKANNNIEEPHYGFAIKNRLGVSAFETNTYCMGFKTNPLKTGEVVIIEFSLNCNLLPDLYAISIGVSSKGYGKNSFEFYHLFIHDIVVINVLENPNSIQYLGYYNMKPTVIIMK